MRPLPKRDRPPEQPEDGYPFRFIRNSLDDLPLQKWHNPKLSSSLILSIDRWKDDFIEHTFGLMDTADRQQWIAEGKRLAAEVRREWGQLLP